MKYLLLIAALLLTGCSLNPHGSHVLVQVEMPGSLQKTITGLEPQYGCYFVHVAGIGIVPNYTLEDLGNHNLACLFRNLGTTSAFVDADQMTNDGVEIKLPVGSAAVHFKLLRISSSTGSCPSTLAELFSNPDLYDLYSYGDADVLALTRDTQVEIIQNNEGSPTEIIGACQAGGLGGLLPPL